MSGEEQPLGASVERLMKLVQTTLIGGVIAFFPQP